MRNHMLRAAGGGEVFNRQRWEMDNGNLSVWTLDRLKDPTPEDVDPAYTGLYLDKDGLVAVKFAALNQPGELTGFVSYETLVTADDIEMSEYIAGYDFSVDIRGYGLNKGTVTPEVTCDEFQLTINANPNIDGGSSGVDDYTVFNRKWDRENFSGTLTDSFVVPADTQSLKLIIVAGGTYENPYTTMGVENFWIETDRAPPP